MNRLVAIKVSVMVFSLVMLVLIGMLSLNVKPFEAYAVLGLTIMIRTMAGLSKPVKRKFKLDWYMPSGAFLIASTGLGMGMGSEHWDNIARALTLALCAVFIAISIYSDVKLSISESPN